MTTTKEVPTYETTPTALTIAPNVQPQLGLSEDSSPWGLANNLALIRFLGGEEPHLRQFQAGAVAELEAILPDEGSPIRHISTGDFSAVLLTGEGWTGAILSNKNSRQTFVTITAISDELAKTIAKQIQSKVPVPASDPDEIEVVFWHQTMGGVRHTLRRIEAPAWDEIRRNYASQPRAAVESLMRLSSPEAGGRIILLHGEPGTGKTTAIRALARSWEKWCSADYIVDADRLFGSPSYLLEIIMNPRPVPGATRGRRPWRLLIVEDCDELIRADAKNATGQALSRLLNVTDGMLGQGLKVLFLITTNEELQRLHKAVVRPGRCLANIAVSRFSRAEAIEWLGQSDEVGPDGATLAELFALTGDHSPINAVAESVPSGLYL